MDDLVHRVALLDRAGRLVRGPRALDDSWPSPRTLRDAVAAAGAVETVPAWRGADGVIIHVLQDADAIGAGEAWAPASAALAERAAGGGPGWSDWYRPGWRDEVDAWIRAQLVGLDLRIVDDAEIVTWWGLSAVLRIPVGVSHVAATHVEGGAALRRDVWFKATCDGFRDEAAITAALAQWPDAPLPEVLAVDEARAWMLLGDVPGAGEEPDLPTVLAAARAMARLQIASIARDLPAALPLRDAVATIEGLRTVIHDSVEQELMPEDLRAAARGAESRLAAAVRALEDAGVPLTLAHGDLHTQNLAGAPDAPVIFDWTDACRAHPYLDGRLLAASAVGRRPADADAGATERAVRGAFLEPWRAAFPGVDHDRVWDLAADVLDAFQIVSYENIQRAQPPASRWALGGVLTEKLSRLVVGGAA